MPSNPLAASKTPGIIVSEIIMMRSSFGGVNFLVEGDDDSSFWKHKLHSENVSIVTCEGKSNLTSAASIIETNKVNNVSGIYDADHDRLFGIIHSPSILAVTDHNDLETTLVSSSAFDHVLNEFGDSSKIFKFQADNSIDVIGYVKKLSYKFGRLRYLNRLRSYGVNFDKMSPYRFISAHDWVLDDISLHNEYCRYSGVLIADLENILVAECPAENEWILAQGHDVVRIICQGFKNVIGSRQISEGDLTRLLRLAYSEALLRSSSMYASLNTIQRAMSVSMFR